MLLHIDHLWQDWDLKVLERRGSEEKNSSQKKLFLEKKWPRKKEVKILVRGKDLGNKGRSWRSERCM